MYTTEDIQQILGTLKIQSYRDNKVDSSQAAQILQWRSKQEYGFEHPYTPTSIRRRIVSGDLQPERINARLNIYDVEQVFHLSLNPKRAAGGKQRRTKEHRIP